MNSNLSATATFVLGITLNVTISGRWNRYGDFQRWLHLVQRHWRQLFVAQSPRDYSLADRCSFQWFSIQQLERRLHRQQS
jgi:hypothetical protein